MSNKQYSSVNLTLSEIVDKNLLFNIPIYQRLYVWKELQVKKLLEDLFEAFKRNKDDKYFLGGIVTYLQNGRHDLIDGQQRFTTLWLISNTICSRYKGNVCDEIKRFCKNGDDIRIRFAIRSNIEGFLYSLCVERAASGEIEQSPDITNLVAAQANIVSFFDQEEVKGAIYDFSAFIMKNVVVVRTEIPEDTDLNKLFELINGRGQQLSHTDILKSKILNIIRKQTKDESRLVRYGKIWDACADMNGYIEHNLYAEGNNTWKELLSYDHSVSYCEEGIVADFGKDFLSKYLSKSIDSCNVVDARPLADIISEAVDQNQQQPNIPEEDTDSGNDKERGVRSIVTFPMLLLYTLRIYLIKKSIRLYENTESCDIPFYNEKKLLLLYSPLVKYLEQKESACEFIELLWNVRVLFDRNIVKWVESDNNKDEVLSINTLRISTDRKGNIRVHRDSNETVTEMTQLQSILYFSQPRIYEHWICPFLLHSFDESDFSDLAKYLKQLDNVLLCLPYETNQDMLYRTYNVMAHGLGNYEADSFIQYFNDALEREDGLRFAHYFFYKMEYILWWHNHRNNLNKKLWNEYRMSSKNSVEHINPQTPKYCQKQISYLNTFGNLVLISREDNSSYGNKSFKEKQAQFIERREKGNRLDSLKSDVIYSTNAEEWNDEQCKAHLTRMEELAEEYFKQVCIDYNAITDEGNVVRKWVVKTYQDNKIQLLQAVFALAHKDEVCFYSGSGYLHIPSLQELSNLPFIDKLYSNRFNLASFCDAIEMADYQHPVNYFFAKYPYMISYCLRGKYFEEGNGRIVLVESQRIGSYNYREVLMLILQEMLKKEGFHTEHFGEVIRTYIYFNGKSFCLEEQEEYVTLWCHYDYNANQMLYEVEVNDDFFHQGKRTRILRANGWEYKNKNLYLGTKSTLHNFRNNKDYDYIAFVCKDEINNLIKKMVRYC